MSANMNGSVLGVAAIVAVGLACLAFPIIYSIRNRRGWVLTGLAFAVAVVAGFVAYNLGFVIIYTTAAVAVALTLTIVAVTERHA